MKFSRNHRILLMCLLVILICFTMKWVSETSLKRQGTDLVRPEVSLEKAYYTKLESIEVQCKQTVLHGDEHDGGYHICNDLEYKPRQPCLVYSFGINYDFSFDDAVSSAYGCEVHSFDPSMTNDQKRSVRTFFYKIGLGGEDTVDSRGWTIKTLTSIKALLNHTKVDILKVDIEDDEHKALPNIMAAGELRHVKQLLFELHIPGMENRARALDFMLHGLQLLRDLYDNGFHVFHSRPNELNYVTSPFTGLTRSTCYELSLVNVNRKKTR